MDPNAPQPQPLPQAPPPDMGAPAQPNVQQAPPAQPMPTPQQADLAHSALLGHGFKSLLSSMGGTTTTYQQGPNGPIPVQSKTGAGGFFRNILAGALAGSVAGSQESNHAGSGWAAAGAGAGAAMNQQKQQQQAAQQQAQQQWQNKLTAQKADQEATAADTENTMRKAQTTLYNLQKVKDLADIQRGTYNDHQEYVKNAAPIVETYKANGLNPVREGVTEEDHSDWLKHHPGDSSLDWQPVGVQNYVSSDGTIGYQTVWDAFEPKGKIAVAPSVLKDWKDSGLLAYRSDLAAGLKPGADGKVSIPYSAFINIQQQSNQLKAQTKAKQADDFTTKQQAATLKHLAAEAQAERASAGASGSEAALRSYQLKQEKAGDAAQANLAKNGGDWGALAPADKVALQPQVQKDITDIRNDLNDPVLKEELRSDDPATLKAAQERAGKLHEALDTAQSRSIFVPPTKAGPPAGATVPFTDPTRPGVAFNIPADQVAAFLAAHPQATKLGAKPAPAEPDTPLGTADPGFGTLIQGAKKVAAVAAPPAPTFTPPMM